MFNQLIIFIIALVLFTLQQPGLQPLYSPLSTLFIWLLSLAFFAFICRLSFKPLARSLEYASAHSSLTIQYHRIQNRLSIIALGALAFDVYVLNIKYYFQMIPGFQQSLSLSGGIGIALFLIHLCIVWSFSHPFYRRIHHSETDLLHFIKANLSFVSAILIPWFLISIMTDLLQLIDLPAFTASDLGQFILLGGVLTVFVLFAPWLVVRLWGCKPIPNGPIRLQLEDFCKRNRFALGDLLLWPLFGSEMLTAGIMGILPKCRYILVTEGLLSTLDPDELKGVLAHEIGHVRRFHIILYLLFFLSYSILAYAFYDFILLLILKQDLFLTWATAPDSLQQTLFSLVYSVPVIFFIVVYFRYVFGFFMRNSERQADLYALKLIGNPYPLISSLKKIAYHSGRIEDLPSWHHFSIRQRIDYLLGCYHHPQLIKQHDRKLYGATLIFFVLVFSLTSLGFHLKETQMVKKWQFEIQARLLEKEIMHQSSNPELLANYGGLLMELGLYDKAHSYLTKASTMAPENATALNNLAWFYATSPPPYFQPQKALRLAQQAANIEPEPYILDTLAEAYYVNGDIPQAVEAIRQALAKQPENRDYFLKQLEKFERGLKKGRSP